MSRWRSGLWVRWSLALPWTFDVIAGSGSCYLAVAGCAGGTGAVGGGGTLRLAPPKCGVSQRV